MTPQRTEVESLRSRAQLALQNKFAMLPTQAKQTGDHLHRAIWESSAVPATLSLFLTLMMCGFRISWKNRCKFSGIGRKRVWCTARRVYGIVGYQNQPQDPTTTLNLRLVLVTN